MFQRYAEVPLDGPMVEIVYDFLLMSMDFSFERKKVVGSI